MLTKSCACSQSPARCLRNDPLASPVFLFVTLASLVCIQKHDAPQLLASGLTLHLPQPARARGRDTRQGTLYSDRLHCSTRTINRIATSLHGWNSEGESRESGTRLLGQRRRVIASPETRNKQVLADRLNDRDSQALPGSTVVRTGCQCVSTQWASPRDKFRVATHRTWWRLGWYATGDKAHLPVREGLELGAVEPRVAPLSLRRRRLHASRMRDDGSEPWCNHATKPCPFRCAYQRFQVPVPRDGHLERRQLVTRDLLRRAKVGTNITGIERRPVALRPRGHPSGVSRKLKVHWTLCGCSATPESGSAHRETYKETLVAGSSKGAMEGRLTCKGLFVTDPLVAARRSCQPNLSQEKDPRRLPSARRRSQPYVGIISRVLASLSLSASVGHSWSTHAAVLCKVLVVARTQGTCRGGDEETQWRSQCRQRIGDGKRNSQQTALQDPDDVNRGRPGAELECGWTHVELRVRSHSGLESGTCGWGDVSATRRATPDDPNEDSERWKSWKERRDKNGDRIPGVEGS
ncbi:hypothetical protein LXA43DRAFT_1062896 [Ganoderma leucocontextum]|nr:hypothetical protein LXA43DRAFT_1062896 [Ganoderma leucocontextum]